MNLSESDQRCSVQAQKPVRMHQCPVPKDGGPERGQTNQLRVRGLSSGSTRDRALCKVPLVYHDCFHYQPKLCPSLPAR